MITIIDYKSGNLKSISNGFKKIGAEYQITDDVEIIAELAKRMKLGDELLEAGYDKGAEYILEGSGIEDWEAVKDAPLPVPVPNAKMPAPGSFIDAPKNTLSGKIELYSETVAKYKDRGLNPLPVCADQEGGADPAAYPFTIMTGARIAAAVHSRTTKLTWLRCQIKDPVLNMNPADAEKQNPNPVLSMYNRNVN